MNIASVEDLIFLAFSIAVIFKLLCSIEDFLMYKHYFSVSEVNDPDRIVLKVFNADGEETMLGFDGLQDYKVWIENHQKVYAQIQKGLSETDEQ